MATITEEIILDAVKKACRAFSGSEGRWKRLTDAGADNNAIAEMVSVELGTYGGQSTEWGWVEMKGGNAFQVKIILGSIMRPDETLILKGERLINLVRRIFQIPSSAGQLQLF